MWHMPCAERWAGWFSQKSWLWKSAWWYDNCGPGLSSDLVLDPQTERCWVHAIPRMSCQNPLGPIFLAMQNALLGPQVGRGLASSHFHATSVRPGERGDAEFVWSLKWQHVRKLSYNVEHGNTRFRPWIVQVNMANFCNFGVPSKEKRGLLVGTVWCYVICIYVHIPSYTYIHVYLYTCIFVSIYIHMYTYRFGAPESCVVVIFQKPNMSGLP